MLSRTLSRQGAQPNQRRWRTAAVIFGAFLALAALYLLLPNPGPRLRDVPFTDEQLRQLVASMAPLPNVPVSPEQQRRAAFGRALFADPAFAASGKVSCVSCHEGTPDAVLVGLRPRPPRTLASSGQGAWFFSDGRADSLGAAALSEAENPAALGTSRLAVVQRLLSTYAQEYEGAFGTPPAAARGLATAGRPAPLAMTLPIEVSAFGLATIGSYQLLDDVLKAAQESRRAPATELSRRAFAAFGQAQPTGEAAAYAAYAALSPEAQKAVDQVFANYGKAIESYVVGLNAAAAPFDQFAARLQTSPTATAALYATFGASELTGLKLFLGPGQCALCHQGPNLSDQQFHNIGLAQRGTDLDFGRATGLQRTVSSPFNCLAATPAANALDNESCREMPYLAMSDLSLVGAFKTPSLRHVVANAPYMHDGRYRTLAEVLAFYNDLEAKPALGKREGTLHALNFTDEEIAALTAFLHTL